MIANVVIFLIAVITLIANVVFVRRSVSDVVFDVVKEVVSELVGGLLSSTLGLGTAR